MSRVTSWATSVFLRALWSLHPDDWSHGPRPDARGVVHAVGDDPIRILMFGGGPLVGYGVRTHDLALAGHLGRELGRRLGRGVEVEVVSAVDLTAAAAISLAESLEVRSASAVIVAIGVQDAMQFSDPVRWQRDVEQMLAELANSRCPNRPPLPILVLGVPPISSIARVPVIASRILDSRSASLSDRLSAIVAERPDSTFVPFTPPKHGVAARHRESATYREWAQLVAPAAERWLSHSSALSNS